MLGARRPTIYGHRAAPDRRPADQRQGDAVRRSAPILAPWGRRPPALLVAGGIHRGRPPRPDRRGGGLRRHRGPERRAGRSERRVAGRRRYHAAQPDGRRISGGTMDRFGYWNKILHVNLSDRTTWIEEPGDAFFRRYGGG